ncbi:MAG: hypothetical protein ABSF48_08770, partial [Thermodesulfobacteriota bacterium]
AARAVRGKRLEGPLLAMVSIIDIYYRRIRKSDEQRKVLRVVRGGHLMCYRIDQPRDRLRGIK